MSLNTPGTNASPLLHQESSDLSDYSTSTFVETPVSAITPGSPVQHRPGYRRVTSLNDQDTAYHGSEQPMHRREGSNGFGLGIKNLQRLPSPSSSPATPGSANTLLSPQPVQSHKAYRRLENDPILEDDGNWEDNTSRTEPYQPFVADSETESLRKHTTAPTVQSFEPPGTRTYSLVRKSCHLLSFNTDSILRSQNRDAELSTNYTTVEAVGLPLQSWPFRCIRHYFQASGLELQLPGLALGIGLAIGECHQPLHHC